MIISPTSKTQVHGISSTAFNIKATSKAFSILTANLYSNKERSVVREICANAFDSHISAGKQDVPFSVKLPTFLDPNFVVQDYGIGLNKEDAINLFSTIFKSTKDNSNSHVGAFGLGSKSPFAISDSFSATCIKDGIKTQILIFKGDDGTPQISVVAELKTTEANGVTISVPIANYAVDYFNVEAVAALYPFYPKPICNRDFTSLYDDGQVLFENEFCVITKGHGISSRIMIMNGPALYNIPRHVFNNDMLRRFDRFYNYYSDYVCIIKSNIGDIDIPPSRETLDETPRTKAFINKQASNIIKNALDEAIAFIKNLKIHSSLGKIHHVKKALSGMAISYFVNEHELSGIVFENFKKIKSGALREHQRICKLVHGRVIKPNQPNGYTHLRLLDKILGSKYVIFDDVPHTAWYSSRAEKVLEIDLKKKLIADGSDNIPSQPNDICFVERVVKLDRSNKTARKQYSEYRSNQADKLQKYLNWLLGEGEILVTKTSEIKEFNKKLNALVPKPKAEVNDVIQIRAFSGGGIRTLKVNTEHFVEVDNNTVIDRNSIFFLTEDELTNNLNNQIVYQYLTKDFDCKIYIAKNQRQLKFVKAANIPHVDKLIEIVVQECKEKLPAIGCIGKFSLSWCALSDEFETVVMTTKQSQYPNIHSFFNYVDNKYDSDCNLSRFVIRVKDNELSLFQDVDFNSLLNEEFVVDNLKLSAEKSTKIRKLLATYKSIHNLISNIDLIGDIVSELVQLKTKTIDALEQYLGE